MKAKGNPKDKRLPSLPKALVDNWLATVRARARPPRGFDAREASDEVFAKAVMRSEAQSVRDLWAAFTTQRTQLARYLLDPKKQAVAYLLGFHLTNLARFVLTASRVGSLPKFGGKVQVWDLGCGTGALSLGFAHLAMAAGNAPDALDMHLVDNKEAFLDTAALGLHTLHEDLAVTTHKWDLKKGLKITAEKGEPVVILMGYTWNEISRHAPTARAVMNEIQRLKSRGPVWLWFLDPANQNPARDAQTLRDGLVANGWTALYPCPAGVTHCPLLELSRDWCYSEYDWYPPAPVREMDRLLELNHQVLACAAYVFQSEPFPTERDDIIVGRPSIKGKEIYNILLCTNKGLKKTPGKGGAFLWRRGTSYQGPITAPRRDDEPKRDPRPRSSSPSPRGKARKR